MQDRVGYTIGRTAGAVFFLLASLCCIQSKANDTISVKKDPRLDMLSARQIQLNKHNAMLTPAGLYKGFRIQVLSTSSRANAFDLQSMLNTNYPDQKAYVTYLSPNFKVRIGNFLKRSDAENFKKELSKLFPEGTYIVEDTIEYAPPPEEEDIIPQ